MFIGFSSSSFYGFPLPIPACKYTIYNHNIPTNLKALLYISLLHQKFTFIARGALSSFNHFCKTLHVMDWQALFVILCFFDNHHLVQCHFDHQISHHDHLGIISEFWKYVYSCCCCKLFVLDLIMETPRGNQDYLFWSIDKCIKSTLHVRKKLL